MSIKRIGRETLCKCDRCGYEWKATKLRDRCGNRKKQCRGWNGQSFVRRHGFSRTGVYKSWNAMMQRCLNPKNHAYSRYGGSGITVCKRWLKIENFIADMGQRPAGKTLERIDNDRGYSPKNCIWTTQEDQMNNTSYNRFFEYGGKVYRAKELAAEHGVNLATFWIRIHRGWTVEKALTKPLGYRNSRSR